MKKYYLFLLITFFGHILLFGQDTVRIYFKSGSAKIGANELERLNELPNDYDLSGLDSVQYVGIADSVGSERNNLRLSEKRARNVANYCENILPTDVPQSIYARGEVYQGNLEKHRSVQIILYFAPPPIDTIVNRSPKNSLDTSKTPNDNGKNNALQQCYYIDYELLQQSHYREITKGKKKWVILETEKAESKPKTSYYTGVMDKQGRFSLRRLHWVTKPTGRSWWQKSRRVMTIPQESFAQFKLFRLQDAPCDDCHEDFASNPKISKEGKMRRIDRFLMQNLQGKSDNPLSAKIWVRAPREYVDESALYFWNCDNTPIDWQSRRGRRRKHYLYVEVPLRRNGYLANITKIMPTCAAKDSSDCDFEYIKCNFEKEYLSPMPNFAVELGMNYQENNSSDFNHLAAYLGVSAIYSIRLKQQLSLVLGADSQLRFYGLLRYQYSFIRLPIYAFSDWHALQDMKRTENDLRFYVGTELSTALFGRGDNYLMQNLHLGASYSLYRGKIIFFAQAGAGVNYLNLPSFAPQFMATFGIRYVL